MQNLISQGAQLFLQIRPHSNYLIQISGRFFLNNIPPCADILRAFEGGRAAVFFLLEPLCDWQKSI